MLICIQCYTSSPKGHLYAERHQQILAPRGLRRHIQTNGFGLKGGFVSLLDSRWFILFTYIPPWLCPRGCVPFLFFPSFLIFSQLDLSSRFTSFYPDTSPDLFSRRFPPPALFKLKTNLSLKNTLLIELTPRCRQPLRVCGFCGNLKES